MLVEGWRHSAEWEAARSRFFASRAAVAKNAVLGKFPRASTLQLEVRFQTSQD